MNSIKVNGEFWLSTDLYNKIIEHRKLMIENNKSCKEFELDHSEDESIQLYLQDFLYKFGYRMLDCGGK